jgi:hypothetical protein
VGSSFWSGIENLTAAPAQIFHPQKVHGGNLTPPETYGPSFIDLAQISSTWNYMFQKYYKKIKKLKIKKREWSI